MILQESKYRFYLAGVMLLLATLISVNITMAQSAPEPSKNKVASCMKAATENKNAVYQSAKETYKTALKSGKEEYQSTRQKAKDEGNRETAREAKIKYKETRKSARDAYKTAKKAAKEAFGANRKNCKTKGEVSEKTEKTLTVNLIAQNNSGQSGVAVLKERDGKVEVRVNLGNAPKNTSQPAHIHGGSCPKPGAIYYPLKNLENGKSETELEIALDKLKAELPLAINVHKSASEAGIYLSCGDLKF